jgi:hypothetical protein
VSSPGHLRMGVQCRAGCRAHVTLPPYSPIARHHGFKASHVPALLSITREATASPASLLSPSVLLHCTTKPSLTPPLVSRAWVDWRFLPASLTTEEITVWSRPNAGSSRRFRCQSTSPVSPPVQCSLSQFSGGGGGTSLSTVASCLGFRPGKPLPPPYLVWSSPLPP